MLANQNWAHFALTIDVDKRAKNNKLKVTSLK